MLPVPLFAACMSLVAPLASDAEVVVLAAQAVQATYPRSVMSYHLNSVISPAQFCYPKLLKPGERWGGQPKAGAAGGAGTLLIMTDLLLIYLPFIDDPIFYVYSCWTWWVPGQAIRRWCYWPHRRCRRYSPRRRS